MKNTDLWKRLLAAAVQSQDSVLKKYSNTYEGFSPERVEKMRGKYGENRITDLRFCNPARLVSCEAAHIHNGLLSAR